MLHILTFATDRNKIASLAATAKIFNVNIIYLFAEEWHSYVDKITSMIDALESIPDDHIVCFIDAYDVLVNAPYDEIMEKFSSFRTDVVFGAEMNCFPERFRGVFDSLPPPRTKFMYLNSGGYIGYRRAVYDILKWKKLEEITEICKDGGDQAYFMDCYLNSGKAMVMDTECKIFQCMFRVSWEDVIFVGGRVFNKVLNRFPCFVHFNGGTWMTRNQDNILPVIVQKLRESQEHGSVLNLDDYEQYYVPGFIYPCPQLLS